MLATHLIHPGYIEQIGTSEYASDSDTVMLLHGNNSTADASGNGNVCAANGSASFNSSVKKLGSHALDCNTGNAQADYWSVAASADFSFGTNPFTIDFWWYIRDTESQSVLFIIGSHNTAGEIKIRATVAGTVSVEITPTGGGSQFYSSETPSTAIAINTWYHFALVRSGNTFTVFHNGTSIGTVTNSGAAGSNAAIRMGTRGIGSQNLDGLLDEVRVSTVARWTSNFAVKE